MLFASALPSTARLLSLTIFELQPSEHVAVGNRKAGTGMVWRAQNQAGVGGYICKIWFKLAAQFSCNWKVFWVTSPSGLFLKAHKQSGLPEADSFRGAATFCLMIYLVLHILLCDLGSCGSSGQPGIAWWPVGWPAYGVLWPARGGNGNSSHPENCGGPRARECLRGHVVKIQARGRKWGAFWNLQWKHSLQGALQKNHFD